MSKSEAILHLGIILALLTIGMALDQWPFICAATIMTLYKLIVVTFKKEND